PGAGDAERCLPATLEPAAARVGSGGGLTAGADVLAGARRLSPLSLATGPVDRDSRGPFSGRRVREPISGDGSLAASRRPLRGGRLYRRARWLVCELALGAAGPPCRGLDRSLPGAHGSPRHQVRVHL